MRYIQLSDSVYCLRFNLNDLYLIDENIFHNFRIKYMNHFFNMQILQTCSACMLKINDYMAGIKTRHKYNIHLTNAVAVNFLNLSILV